MWNKSRARHLLLDGGQRARVKMPRKRQLSFMNYLPFCDLRRESSYCIRKSRWRLVQESRNDTYKKELKAVWGVETPGEEKIGRSRRKDASNWQPRKPSPSDCSLLWRVSKFTLSLSTNFFLFYFLVFHSPDLLLYCTSARLYSSRHHSWQWQKSDSLNRIDLFKFLS